MKKFLFLLILLELILLAIFVIAPDFAMAQEGEPVNIPNPLGPFGVNTPGKLVVKAFQGFAAIIVAVAIAFTVFSGFKLIIASNEESIQSAKESLKWSVGGFVVALLSFTIISGTANFLGFRPIDLRNDNVIQNPINIGDAIRSGDFVAVMNAVMVNFLGIVGFATTLMIIYYGYRYLTVAGNEESIDKAKSGLKWSIMGLIITLLAFTIITAVRQLLLSGPPS